MIKDTGFMVLGLENNEFHDTIIVTVAEYIQENPFKQICIFNNVSDKSSLFNVPLLHTSQARFFDGDLVVFDLLSLMIALNFPGKENVYYYAQDFPWVGHHNAYKVWKDLMLRDNLRIIAHSQQCYDIYNLCWKTPIGISEDFTYDKVSKVL